MVTDLLVFCCSLILWTLFTYISSKPTPLKGKFVYQHQSIHDSSVCTISNKREQNGFHHEFPSNLKAIHRVRQKILSRHVCWFFIDSRHSGQWRSCSVWCFDHCTWRSFTFCNRTALFRYQQIAFNWRFSCCYFLVVFSFFHDVTFFFTINSVSHCWFMWIINMNLDVIHFGSTEIKSSISLISDMAWHKNAQGQLRMISSSARRPQYTKAIGNTYCHQLSFRNYFSSKDSPDPSFETETDAIPNTNTGIAAAKTDTLQWLSPGMTQYSNAVPTIPHFVLLNK